MSETALLRAILAAVGARPDARLFRNHVGQGWTGILRTQHGGMVLLAEARRCAFGLAPGSSDLVGWQSVVVTPDMVGMPLARFVAIEAKGPRTRTTDGQERFLAAVRAAGGVAGIARSPAEAAVLLGPAP